MPHGAGGSVALFATRNGFGLTSSPSQEYAPPAEMLRQKKPRLALASMFQHRKLKRRRREEEEKKKRRRREEEAPNFGHREAPIWTQQSAESARQSARSIERCGVDHAALHACIPVDGPAGDGVGGREQRKGRGGQNDVDVIAPGPGGGPEPGDRDCDVGRRGRGWRGRPRVAGGARAVATRV